MKLKVTTANDIKIVFQNGTNELYATRWDGPISQPAVLYLLNLMEVIEDNMAKHNLKELEFEVE